MPIYEYQCQSCEDIIEKFQSMSDEPLVTCPSCSGKLKKLVSMSSFQLKGGGWYADGYSNTTSGGSACAAGKNSSSSDSKPAACPAKNSSCGCA